MKPDFTFGVGDFNSTTVEIFPMTDKGREFLKVDSSVHSFTVKKSTMIDIFIEAEREGVSFMDFEFAAELAAQGVA